MRLETHSLLKRYTKVHLESGCLSAIGGRKKEDMEVGWEILKQAYDSYVKLFMRND